MKKKSIISLTTTILFIFTFTFFTQAQTNAPGDKGKIEKPAKDVKLVGKNVDKSLLVNANIKVDKSKSDVTAAGSDCSYACTTEVDNYSAYTIDVYLDGIYAGTVPPKSYITVATCNGYTIFYGISAGKTKEWLSTGDCQFKMIWTLSDN
jgi:hypothetical protein